MDRPDSAAWISCNSYVKELVRAAWENGFQQGEQSDPYNEYVDPIEIAWNSIIGACDFDITDPIQWEKLTNG